MKIKSALQQLSDGWKAVNERPSSYERKGGQPIDYSHPTYQTCTRVYKTAGQYERGVREMAQQGWRVVTQSSATPNRIGRSASTGWTKTMVVFERGSR